MKPSLRSTPRPTNLADRRAGRARVGAFSWRLLVSSFSLIAATIVISSLIPDPRFVTRELGDLSSGLLISLLLFVLSSPPHLVLLFVFLIRRRRWCNSLLSRRGDRYSSVPLAESCHRHFNRRVDSL
jgi:hypothetical protein